MKRFSILFTLLLTLSFLLILGCDNGSVSESAITKSSGLVKVSFTVDGDSSGLQKASSLDGFAFTYQYKAVPQWTSNDTIHGRTDSWTPIDYFEGMSLGFFTPGQWVFYIQILDGSTVVYEGHSDIIGISESESNVTIYVTRIIHEIVPGVFISVTAPTENNDSLTVKWGDGQGDSAVANKSSSGGITTFSYSNTNLDGTYTFTLTHSNGQIQPKRIEDVTVSSTDSISLISGYLDNGEWNVNCTTKQIYDVNLELYNWNDEAWDDPSPNPGGYYGTVDYINYAVPGDRVSFSPRPVTNSRVLSISVKCGNEDVPYIRQGTLYLFIMPEGGVTIRVKFSNVNSPYVDALLFKTVVRALYAENDVVAFGKYDANDDPPGNEAVTLGDVNIWYSNRNNKKKICWEAGNAEGKAYLSDGSLAGLFRDHSKYTSINMNDIMTSDITDMSSMFQGCSELTTLNLGSFDASSVTDISNMFQGCASLANITVSAFNTNISSGVNMAGLFKDCAKLAKINNRNFVLPVGFNTSRAVNLAGMFQGCAALKSLNLTDFNAGSATDISSMFQGCTNLQTLTLTGFTINSTSPVKMKEMFRNCSKLTSLDVSSLNTSMATDMSGMFRNCSKLTSLDVSSFNTSMATNMSGMFRGCVALTGTLNLSNFNTNQVSDMSYMFCECKALTGITVGDNFRTPLVTDMSYMFSSVDEGTAGNKNNKMNLTNLDFVSQFVTTKVTNMSHMFYMCSNSNLRSIPVSNFNTSNVTDMSFMFGCWDGSPSFVQAFDLSGWDFSKVTTVNRMFDRCQSAEITFPDRTKLTSIGDILYWFSHCFAMSPTDLENIIKSWDFSGYVGPNGEDDGQDDIDYLNSLFGNISNTDTSPEASPSNRLFKNTMTAFNNRQTYNTYRDQQDPNFDNPIKTLHIGGDLSKIKYQRLTTVANP